MKPFISFLLYYLLNPSKHRVVWGSGLVNRVEVDGDIIIGGIHRVMAMLFAIDKINKDDSLLPGITLGAKILDTCSDEQYALNMSLSFVEDIMIENGASEYTCGDGYYQETPRVKSPVRPLAGVIGASYSGVTTMVAHFLRIFQVVQISPAATNAQLSDKVRFDFFARTVASDEFQVQVIADLLKEFNWTYVSLLHSDTDYGRMGSESFKKVANLENICIAFEAKLTDDIAIYEGVLKDLTSFTGASVGAAKVVVLFARNDHVQKLLQTATVRHDVGFQWVASDGWETTTNRIVQNSEEIAKGAMIVSPRATRIPDFETFFKAWNPWNDLYKSRWLFEWWMEKFNCSLQNLIATDHEPLEGVNYCPEPDEGFVHENFASDDKVEFVVDAVYALAHALHALHRERCHGEPRVCDAMLTAQRTSLYSGKEFYNKYLMNVSFKSINQKTEFRFDEKGDGPPAYVVKNYQFIDGNCSSSKYVRVGEWTKGLTLDSRQSISWPDGIIPISSCSPQCQVGEKLMQPPSSCCWSCVACERHAKVSENGKACENCPKGFWPTRDRLSCYDLQLHKVKVLPWDSVYAIVSCCLSSLGMAFTVFVIIVLFKFRKTPVVKASGRELSFTILGGIFLSYLMTFIIIVRPSAPICVIRRIGAGLSFSILYSALLVKTNRIYRIFESAKYSARPPRCRGSGYIFLCSLSYVAILILVCTVYAVLTRKVPETYNETKFIGFTMYTTCIIWLAFIPIYFGTGSDFRIQATALCISISLSATVSLVLLFAPKVWVIFLEPEKNVAKPQRGIASLVVGYHAQAGSRPSRDDESEYIKTPNANSPLLNNYDKSPQKDRGSELMTQYTAIAAAEVLRNENFTFSDPELMETNLDEDFEYEPDEIFM